MTELSIWAAGGVCVRPPLWYPVGLGIVSMNLCESARAFRAAAFFLGINQEVYGLKIVKRMPNFKDLHTKSISIAYAERSVLILVFRKMTHFGLGSTEQGALQ